jgi:uncharacterized protein (DUF342 family)
MTWTQVQTPFQAQVSADHLQASITLRKDADRSTVTPGDVVAALEAAKVAVDDKVAARIQEYIRNVVAGRNAYDTVVLAEGYAPIEGRDGAFEWAEGLCPEQDPDPAEEEGNHSYYSVSSFVVVHAGDVIGTVSPPVPGKPGLDVHHNALNPKKAPREVVLKENVDLGRDQRTVLARVAGQVVFQDLELRVIDVLDVPGNVDFSVGNIDSPSAVNVRGNIQDLFKVRTKKTLTVGGAIEAAEVDAEGNVEVRGGILNRTKGYVRSNAQVKAKFCTEATIQAQGDIIIGKEALNSKMRTEAQILITNGALIGGTAYARAGLSAKVLGSDAGVPTDIGVGVPEEMLRELNEADAENARRRQGVDKIRELIGPLLAQPKLLTQAQKERATEIMFQADQIEDAIRKTDERIRQGVAQLSAAPSEEEAKPDDTNPHVTVTSRICQGVSIRIDDRVTSFIKEMKGPVRICKRKIKNHTVIAAVNTLSGSVTELNSRRVDLRDEAG